MLTTYLSATPKAAVVLAHGADVNQKLKSPLLRRHNSTSTQSLGEGTTPLLRAAASGDVPMMRLTQSPTNPYVATFSLGAGFRHGALKRRRPRRRWRHHRRAEPA